VIGIIRGGLIDDIYVVNNELPVMLISNTSLVDKGHLVQDKTLLIGVAAGRIVWLVSEMQRRHRHLQRPCGV
jgi:hypothetical protein